ncbi:exodeoxyribonuclease VII small subunit [Thermoleophilia bacterium SCSIO 60948]|nr:exodeoxyribonuclease VII small subunit [Thermoleophilia bacterium SCSIO 60948]
MTDPPQPDAPQPGEAEAAPSYESAVARLELIIARLDSGEAELRETLELCREAKGLIGFCKSELDAVSGELRELRLDELVGELDQG